MFKKHMTPLTKKGSLHTHVGKGAVEKPLMPTPSSNTLPTFGQNYAKQDSMPGGADNDQLPAGMPGTDNDEDDYGS